MKNYLAVSVKFVPRTDFKGSRIKLSYLDINKTYKKFIPYDYEFSTCSSGAEAWFTARGCPPEAWSTGNTLSGDLLFNFYDRAKVIELLTSRSK